MTAITKSEFFLAGIVAIVTAAAFFPAVTCDFVSLDDGIYVAENPGVLGGLTPAGISYALRTVVASNWAPLTILSYQLDATVLGRNPWGFHLTNVLVHAAAAAMLCVALTRMTDRPAASWAASLIWAVHPLRVESVAWVSERKDVLSVAFLAATLLCYERYCRRPSAARMAGVAAAMLAGLLCKASLVTVPVLLLVLDAWPLTRLVSTLGGQAQRPSRYAAGSWRALVWEKSPLVCISIIFIVITLLSQSSAMAATERLPLLTARLPNAIHGTVWYAAKTFWPSQLHPVRMHRGGDVTAVATAAYTIAIVGVLVAAWRARHARPYLLAGLMWYLVALAPVSGIIQVGAHGTADRHSYIPQIGLVIAAVWMVADVAIVARAGRVAAGLAAGVVAACIVLDLAQIRTWKDSETLWNHVVSVEPDNFIGHDHLGNLWHTRHHFENTEHHYLEALRASRQQPRFIANLAWLYADVGDVQRARQYRDWALRAGPRDPDVRRMAERMKEMRQRDSP